MKNELATVPPEVVEHKIYLIRGVKVMLDFDLAKLYQVPTKVFNQAVKRNKNRFPDDFMFQLTKDEFEFWRSQIVTSGSRSQIVTLKRGQNIKYLPYAFTEQGVAMLSAVLKSKRAVETSILIVRAFIKLREMLQSQKDLLVEIEKIKMEQEKHGENISAIIGVINKFLTPAKESSKKKFGFQPKD